MWALHTSDVSWNLCPKCLASYSAPYSTCIHGGIISVVVCLQPLRLRPPNAIGLCDACKRSACTIKTGHIPKSLLVASVLA